jgi:hypothetical protein
MRANQVQPQPTCILYRPLRNRTANLWLLKLGEYV